MLVNCLLKSKILPFIECRLSVNTKQYTGPDIRSFHSQFHTFIPPYKRRMMFSDFSDHGVGSKNFKINGGTKFALQNWEGNRGFIDEMHIHETKKYHFQNLSFAVGNYLIFHG